MTAPQQLHVFISLSVMSCVTSLGPCSSTMSCPASSDPACVTQCPDGATSQALHSSCIRVGFWLEPRSWISQKTAACRQTGLEGMALSSWKKQGRHRQLCGFSATAAADADWMCSLLAAPSRTQREAGWGGTFVPSHLANTKCFYSCLGSRH